MKTYLISYNKFMEIDTTTEAPDGEQCIGIRRQGRARTVGQRVEAVRYYLDRPYIDMQEGKRRVKRQLDGGDIYRCIEIILGNTADKRSELLAVQQFHGTYHGSRYREHKGKYYRSPQP